MKLFLKIIIILIEILVILYLLLSYINTTFIPFKLKNLIIESIKAQGHNDAAIDSFRFDLAKGFVLSGVKIYRGPKEDNGLIFEADDISFAAIWIPSFGKQRIIIPWLRINSPYVKIERTQAGDWNISSFFIKAEQPKEKSMFRFGINSITFDRGVLSFKDNYNKGFQKTIKGLKGRVMFLLLDTIDISASSQIDNAPVKIGARYRPSKKDLFLDFETKNFTFADYWNEYISSILYQPTAMPDAETPAANNILKIGSGLCDTSLEINISGLEKVKAAGYLNIRGLKAEYNNLTVSGNYRLSGNAAFNIKGTFEPAYNMILELDNAKALNSFKPLQHIEDISGKLILSEKRWFTKDMAFMLYGSPASLSGEVESPHKNFILEAELSSLLHLKNISRDFNIDIRSGEAKIDTKLIYKKGGNYYIGGNSEIKNLKLYQNEIAIMGDFHISAESSGAANEWDAAKYKGAFTFKDATIEGVGMLPLISGASGEAAFSTKELTIKRITGKAADTKIELSGIIDYKEKEPIIDLSLKANNLSLTKLFLTMPQDIKTRFEGIEAGGVCSLNMNIQGVSTKLETLTYKGNISLKDSSLTLPYWPNYVSNIDGDIIFEKDRVSWQGLYFDIEKIRYGCDGKLINFARPQISLNLKSKDIDAALEVNTDKDNVINIAKCSGRFHNSNFLIAGSIKDTKTLYAIISGNVYLDLEDLTFIFTKQADTIKRFKPDGIVKLALDMNGPLKEFTNWAFFVEGSSDKIYIGGLEFDNFYLDYRMKDRFIDIPTIEAHPYNGTINIDCRTNLKTEDEPYIININVKDIDLHQLIQDTEFKYKKISGAFSAKAVLNGFLTKKESMKGNGWLQVADGYLWEFPVMRGIMEILFGIPPEYVVLTDAFGNFAIENNKLYTEDFKMLSKTASLLWVGSLGFDGSLDFNITGRFAEDVIKQTTEPGKIASAILHEAGELIMEVKLTGTLAKPKYQLVPFPVGKIVQDQIFERIGNIFGRSEE